MLRESCEKVKIGQMMNLRFREVLDSYAERPSSSESSVQCRLSEHRLTLSFLEVIGEVTRNYKYSAYSETSHRGKGTEIEVQGLGSDTVTDAFQS